jgi:TfoX/Sxy family transcriptional regulator of competence genes
MAKKSLSAPSDILALYEKLVAANPKVERKGAAMPYTSVNGHMFSFLTKSGIFALRLPEEEREAFLKKHHARLCEQHGIVLKEYVEVPLSLLRRTKALQTYFEKSFKYVRSLKPRSTPRKKTAKKAPKSR